MNGQINTKPKEEFKKICFYVYMRQDSQVRIIASEEGEEFATLLRGFIDEGIVRWLKEKSTVKESAYCQNSSCTQHGKLLPKRKLHPVIIGFETFHFCDPCYFNGEYKNYIRQMI
jgi:hypothetical protein